MELEPEIVVLKIARDETIQVKNLFFLIDDSKEFSSNPDSGVVGT